MRQIKLAVLAALTAMVLSSAVGAGTAGAASLLAPEADETELLAAPVGTHTFDTTSTGAFDCNAPNIEGETIGSEYAVNEIASQWLGNYSCTLFGNTQLKTNGCQYTFHPGDETAAGVFDGTFDIGPPGCGPMTIEFLNFCKTSIPAQTDLAATFENVGSGSDAKVKMTVATSALETTDSACGSDASGEYSGSWTLFGRGEEGEKSGIRLAAPVLFVSGEESAEPAAQPKLDSDFFPIGIRGEGTAPFTFSTPAGTAECATSEFGGASLVPTASKALDASYAKCKAFGFANANVQMNSCKQVFALANEGPPYAGSVGISCSEPGDAVKITPIVFGFPACTVALPPQTLAEATYENAGTGSARHVEVAFEGAGVEYAEESGSYCELGSGSNGSVSGAVDLTGFDQ